MYQYCCPVSGLFRASTIVLSSWDQACCSFFRVWAKVSIISTVFLSLDFFSQILVNIGLFLRTIILPFYASNPWELVTSENFVGCDRARSSAYRAFFDPKTHTIARALCVWSRWAHRCGWSQLPRSTDPFIVEPRSSGVSSHAQRNEGFHGNRSTVLSRERPTGGVDTRFAERFWTTNSELSAMRVQMHIYYLRSAKCKIGVMRRKMA